MCFQRKLFDSNSCTPFNKHPFTSQLTVLRKCIVFHIIWHILTYSDDCTIELLLLLLRSAPPGRWEEEQQQQLQKWKEFNTTAERVVVNCEQVL